MMSGWIVLALSLTAAGAPAQQANVSFFVTRTTGGIGLLYCFAAN